eukprot:3936687-Rhodomonas_salina.2
MAGRRYSRNVLRRIIQIGLPLVMLMADGSLTGQSLLRCGAERARDESKLAQLRPADSDGRCRWRGCEGVRD